MGHIGVKGLKHAVEGLEYEDDSTGNCDICAKANIKKLPFPKKSDRRASRVLERVHSDICGPLANGYGGYHYFILFIDKWSCYIFIYFLTKQSEALNCFKHYKASVEAFHNAKILYLRVDNALELVEGEFRQFCEENGISYEKTVPDAPQQNGKSERTNQTLERMTRAMLLDADLHDFFWPFATQTGVYSKNHIPHSALPPNVTPFLRWFKHKPNISHFRPFGTHCTARIVNQKLPKLNPRGELGRFLGYDEEAKGYIIWVLSSRTIKTRRDLIFHGPPTQPLGQGGVDLQKYSNLWE
jgi:transposase InsO family protein